MPTYDTVEGDEAVVDFLGLPDLYSVAMLRCEFLRLQTKITLHLIGQDADLHAGHYVCKESPETIVNVRVDDQNLPFRLLYDTANFRIGAVLGAGRKKRLTRVRQFPTHLLECAPENSNEAVRLPRELVLQPCRRIIKVIGSRTLAFESINRIMWSAEGGRKGTRGGLGPSGDAR